MALVPEVNVGGGEDLEVFWVVPAQLLSGEQSVRDNALPTCTGMLLHALDKDDLCAERTLMTVPKKSSYCTVTSVTVTITVTVHGGGGRTYPGHLFVLRQVVVHAQLGVGEGHVVGVGPVDDG